MTARIIMKLRVAEAHLVTSDVLHVHLVHPLRPELPAWTAGAHVDLRMPDGRVRQYSLCGDPKDSTRYRIAVKREPQGRGGSVWVHDNLRVGEIVHISAPRNNLPIAAGAKKHVIIAGGIGITPFASMAYVLADNDDDFELHYCARAPESAPLLEELTAVCGPKLQCWFSNRAKRFDPAILKSNPTGTHIYACGPDRLVSAIQETFGQLQWPADQLHLEIFQPTVDENFKAEPFDVTIASTGTILHVPAGTSLLERLRQEGFLLPSSCELGVCGSCECGYRDGLVIHRDKILPTSKRQDRLLPCVSRARVSVTLDF